MVPLAALRGAALHIGPSCDAESLGQRPAALHPVVAKNGPSDFLHIDPISSHGRQLRGRSSESGDDTGRKGTHSRVAYALAAPLALAGAPLT
jgi:hypothetical protein